MPEAGGRGGHARARAGRFDRISDRPEEELRAARRSKNIRPAAAAGVKRYLTVWAVLWYDGIS